MQKDSFFVVEIKPSRSGPIPVSVSWKRIYFDVDRGEWARNLIQEINANRSFGVDGFLYLVPSSCARILARQLVFPLSAGATSWCESPVTLPDGTKQACRDCPGCENWGKLMRVLSVLSAVSRDDAEDPSIQPFINQIKSITGSVAFGLVDNPSPLTDDEVESIWKSLHAKRLRKADQDTFGHLA